MEGCLNSFRLHIRPILLTFRLLNRTVMKTKILFLLLFIVGYNLLLAGQDTTTNISDEKKIYRDKIEDKYQEYLIAQDYRGAIDFLTKEIAIQDIKADEYYLKNTGYFIAMRGLAYYYLQEYDSALNDMNKSIKIVPEWSDAYFFRDLSDSNVDSIKQRSLIIRKRSNLKKTINSITSPVATYI